MIVRTVAGITGTDRDVRAGTWRSRRLVLADDAVGFSLHETVMHAGTATEMWYANHIEAVFCVEGTGSLHDLEHDEHHRIEPGVMYLLDGHERHRVTAETDLRLVCVFNPPCTGRETHQADGSYPLLTAGAAGGAGSAS